MLRRFFNGRGQFVGITRLPHSLRSLWQVYRRRFHSIYPELPWIPFSVIPRLTAIVHSRARVWEVGAGMSTLWLAQRAGRVTSVEASREWYDQLNEVLAQRGFSNVDLRYEWNAERMANFDELPDFSLDLLFVDGGPRHACLEAGFSKVRRGGHIYLDNWDVPDFWPGSEAFLKSRRESILSMQSFTDYVPGSFAVNEGLLIQRRS